MTARPYTIAVVGGGYAGLACLARLARRFPDTRRVLVDPGAAHVKRTRLQEVLRRPLADIQVDYRDLAERFEFRHRRARVDCCPGSLTRYARNGRLPVGRRGLRFDALVVATGSPDRPRPARASALLTVSDTGTRDGRDRLIAAAERAAGGGPPVAVVGAGPTGLQYVFELLDFGVPGEAICVVDRGTSLLPGQPEPLRRYVRKRLAARGVRVRQGTRLTSVSGEKIRLVSGRQRSAISMSGGLFCPGAGPERLRADAYGQVLFRGRPLESIYGVGDAATWAARGQDGRTAQAAVRKGRHAADNIRRAARDRMRQEFFTPNLGFFLSMGARDAAGWVLLDDGVVTGLPAAVLREAIETRYELLLDGVDTFSAF